MTTIGTVYTSLGFYRDARHLLRKSLALKEEIYGRQSFEVAEGYSDLSSVSLKEGNYKEKEEYILKSVKIAGFKADKNQEKLAF